MPERTEEIFQRRVVGMDEARTALRPEQSLSGGDGGGTSDGMERRVAALESGLKDINGKLDKLVEVIGDFRLKTSERLGGIENRLTAIETKLEAKANRTDLTSIEVKLATVDGRVANIPTFWQTFFLILGAIVTTVASIAGLGTTFARFLKP